MKVNIINFDKLRQVIHAMNIWSEMSSEISSEHMDVNLFHDLQTRYGIALL